MSSPSAGSSLGDVESIMPCAVGLSRVSELEEGISSSLNLQGLSLVDFSGRCRLGAEVECGLHPFCEVASPATALLNDY